MELAFIREMFDAIAPRYDFLNRLLSLRQDVVWRRTLIRALNLPEHAVVLDAACGTGDVILEITRRAARPRLLVGADFAPEMLKLARRKIRNEAPAAPIRLAAADALHPPFSAGVFDAATIAFGIRNIMDREAALRAFFTCLKPGGQVGVLELATPARKFFRDLYLLYFTRILPRIGALFSRHFSAYTYLPASVIQFPPPEIFAAVMARAGFENIRWRRLSFGVATIHIGRKPKMASDLNQKRRIP